MKKIINQSFFAGLLVVLPIATTLWMVFGILEFTDGLLQKFFPQESFPYLVIPGFGLIFTVIFLLAIGFIAKNLIGRFLFFWIEKLFAAIPFVNRVYTTIKQVLETVLQSQGDQFNSVVLAEFPKEGQWALGFVTSHVPPSVEKAHPDKGKKLQFVFVPTAPNPTSGFLMAIEADRCLKVDISVENAFKLIISGGIVHPEIGHASK